MVGTEWGSSEVMEESRGRWEARECKVRSRSSLSIVTSPSKSFFGSWSWYKEAGRAESGGGRFWGEGAQWSSLASLVARSCSVMATEATWRTWWKIFCARRGFSTIRFARPSEDSKLRWLSCSPAYLIGFSSAGHQREKSKTEEKSLDGRHFPVHKNEALRLCGRICHICWYIISI